MQLYQGSNHVGWDSENMLWLCCERRYVFHYFFLDSNPKNSNSLRFAQIEKGFERRKMVSMWKKIKSIVFNFHDCTNIKSQFFFSKKNSNTRHTVGYACYVPEKYNVCCDNMCCMALQCRLDLATCCPQLCAPDAFCGINGTCMCVPICMKCIATNECDCGALPCPEFCTPYVMFEREARKFQSCLSLPTTLYCQKYSNKNSLSVSCSLLSLSLPMEPLNLAPRRSNTGTCRTASCVQHRNVLKLTA